MKIKIKSLFTLFSALQGVKEYGQEGEAPVLNGLQDVKNAKLSYAIVKNLKKLDSFLSQYRYVVPTKIREYNKLMSSLNDKHIKNEQLGDKKDSTFMYEVEIEKLNKDFENDTKAFRELMKKKDEEINQEVDFEFHKFRLSERLINRSNVISIIEAKIAEPNFSFEKVKEALSDIKKLPSTPGDLPAVTPEQLLILDPILEDVEDDNDAQKR